MYLFVFVWVPSLQEVSVSFPTVALPLGYIFSSFMISMMLGSLLYNAVTSYIPPPPPGSHNESSLTLHAKLSSLVCAVSALALALSTRTESEQVRFWAFCAFEACVGMYYPIQGMLRGTLISNEHRATVSFASVFGFLLLFAHVGVFCLLSLQLSALFRVPLNIFVVVSLMTGVSSARNAVLSASSLMLTFSALVTALVVVSKADDMTGSETNVRPA